MMITDGHSAAAPLLKRALKAFRTGDIEANGGFRWLWLAQEAALEVWDDEALHELAALEIKLVREAGALTALPLALSASAVPQIFDGELTAAASLIDEVTIATEATGSKLAPLGSLVLAAWRGREADLSQLLDATDSQRAERAR